MAAVSEHMLQLWKAFADAGQNIRRTVTILNIGGMDNGSDEKALCIGDDMALPALDLLARVIAPWTASFCGFDALFLSLSKDGCR